MPADTPGCWEGSGGGEVVLVIGKEKGDGGLDLNWTEKGENKERSEGIRMRRGKREQEW